MASEATRSIVHLMSLDGFGPAAARSLVTWASARNLPVEKVVTESSMLEEAIGKPVPPRLLENHEEPDSVIQDLERTGVTFVSIADEDYPLRVREALGKVAPPVLSFQGNIALLEHPSVGFCGSRKATERGLKATRDCAEALARSDVTIVSGYAAGVDTAAHHAALETGGITVAVLAEGQAHFRVRRGLSDVWDWSRSLVVSEFLPQSKWRPSSAMQRNFTICALSRAMILIEASSNSGSYAAGLACLQLNIPLYAADYAGRPLSAEGNRLLMNQGAKKISRTAKTAEPDLTQILRNVHEPPELTPLESAAQLDFFASVVGAS